MLDSGKSKVFIYDYQADSACGCRVTPLSFNRSPLAALIVYLVLFSVSIRPWALQGPTMLRLSELPTRRMQLRVIAVQIRDRAIEKDKILIAIVTKVKERSAEKK